MAASLISVMRFFLACAVGTLLAAPATAQRLGAIVYSSWGQLCSVTPGVGRRCVRSDLEYNDAAWQPGGHQLVAEIGVHDATHSLGLLDRAGRRRHRLAGKSGIRPVWTPDGRQIYAVDYDAGSAVVRWRADGSARTTVPVWAAIVQGGNSRCSPSVPRVAARQS